MGLSNALLFLKQPGLSSGAVVLQKPEGTRCATQRVHDLMIGLVFTFVLSVHEDRRVKPEGTRAPVEGTYRISSCTLHYSPALKFSDCNNSSLLVLLTFDMLCFQRILD